MLKIWGRLNSINVLKVMWSIDELGIEHQRVDAGMQHGVVGENFYAKLNPHRRGASSTGYTACLPDSKRYAP